MSWTVTTRDAARAIPGVERVDAGNVRGPMMDRIAAMITAIESVASEFPLGRDVPVAQGAPKLEKAIDALVELKNIPSGTGFTVTLAIYGHAGAAGRRNETTKSVRPEPALWRQALRQRVRHARLHLRHGGRDAPKAGWKAKPPRPGRTNRRIELRVRFALSPTADPILFKR